MLNILNETLKNYRRGEAFYDSDVNYVLIFSFWDILNEQSLFQELYTILNSLKETIDSFFDISLSCGISSIQNDFSSLGRMYKEAKVALEQKFACSNGKIFVSSHTATTKPVYDLSHKLGVSMPITEEAYKIL